MTAFKYYRIEMEIYIHSSVTAPHCYGLDERAKHAILIRRPADEVFPNPNDMGQGADLVEDDWLNKNRSRLIAKFGSENNFSVSGSIGRNCCREIKEADFKEARFLLDGLAQYEAGDRLIERVGSDFNKKPLY
jgi:hypothetical protein